MNKSPGPHWAVPVCMPSPKTQQGRGQDNIITSHPRKTFYSKTNYKWADYD